jgi:hypothetical protein
MFTQTNEATRGRVSVAHESISSENYERENARLDRDVTGRKAHRKTVTQATETLKDASVLALLVIFAAEPGALSVVRAAKELVKQRQAPPYAGIEQLREYGVDRWRTRPLATLGHCAPCL